MSGEPTEVTLDIHDGAHGGSSAFLSDVDETPVPDADGDEG